MSLAGLRAAALAAALVLALLSRGDVIVLATLLAVGAWRPLPAVAVVVALAGTAWRWSSTALDDIAGAQAVLGPAGVVDPPSAATGAWLAALALVLATPNLVEAWLVERATAAEPTAMSIPLWWKRILAVLPPIAFGAGAAVVVTGPDALDDVGIRVLGTIAAGALAWLVSGRRRVLNRPVLLDAFAALVGAASLVLVSIDAPPLGEVLDRDAFVEGAVLAVAVALLAVGGATTVHLVRSRRDGPTGEGPR